MSAALLNDSQRRDWLRLSRSENVGPITFFKLINRYGGAKQALEALPELSRRGGRKQPLRLYSADTADADLARTAAIGARFVAFGEPDYPALLRAIDDPPPLLCMKGKAELLSAPCVAIIGSRNASAAGRKLARNFAYELSDAGFTVVSGLARGIDTAAHEAALSRATVAVIANGLDTAYPPENRRLQDAIADSGLLISEAVPGTRPKAELFPRRNRIISGVSLGVAVIEAAMRSGSLITARLAGEQGREVFAVPGSPLDPRAAGTNRLIRDGAMLTAEAGDIIGAMNELDRVRQLAGGAGDGHEEDERPPFEEPTAAASPSVRETVIGLLGPSPVSVDDLIRESGADAGNVMAVLLELDVAGRLHWHGQQLVSLT